MWRCVHTHTPIYFIVFLIVAICEFHICSLFTAHIHKQANRDSMDGEGRFENRVEKIRQTAKEIQAWPRFIFAIVRFNCLATMKGVKSMYLAFMKSHTPFPSHILLAKRSENKNANTCTLYEIGTSFTVPHRTFNNRRMKETRAERDWHRESEHGERTHTHRLSNRIFKTLS